MDLTGTPIIQINARSMLALITVCSAWVASAQGINAGLEFFVLGFGLAAVWAIVGYAATHPRM